MICRIDEYKSIISLEILIIDNTPTVTFLLIGPGGKLSIRHLQLLFGKKIRNLIIMVHQSRHDWILIDVGLRTSWRWSMWKYTGSKTWHGKSEKYTNQQLKPFMIGAFEAILQESLFHKMPCGYLASLGGSVA